MFVSNSCYILGYGYLKLSCFSIVNYHDIYRTSTSGHTSGNTGRQFPYMGIYFIKSYLLLWWPTEKSPIYLNMCVSTKTIICNENNESMFYQSVIFVRVWGFKIKERSMSVLHIILDQHYVLFQSSYWIKQ